MHINVQFDAFPGPPAFRNAVLTAAAMIGAALSDNITVNVWVGYGDFGVNGTTPLPSQSISEGNTTGGISVSYSQVRNLLIDHAAPGDATFNSLPAGATIQGQNQVAVWSAQEKALGLLAANNAAYDGFVGIGTNIPTSALVGAALHEIGHALGRLAYGPQPDIFDLFRFTSPGTRLFLLGNTAPAAYFSTDGGVTDLADYGQTSDASDFLGGALTPEDPFNEFYDSGTLQHLTLADLLQFDANGFNLNSSFNPSKVAFSPNDFGDDFGGDVLWRSTSGALAEWNVDGSFLAPANGSSYVTVNGAAVGPDASWSVAGISDFNDDGKADVLWRRSSGELALWTMNGTAVTNSKNVSLNGSIVAPDASWNVIDVGDFNGDGNSDILW
jgi:hypothetical protein